MSNTQHTKEISVTELRETDPKRFDKEYWEWTEYATDYGWWDSTYDDAKERGKEMGFDIDDIQFSGFYSQGDGACWMGSVRIQKYIVANNLQADPPWFTLGELIKDGWVEDTLGISARSTRYSHSNTMQAEGLDHKWTSWDDEAEMTQGPLAGALVQEMVDSVDWEARNADMLEDAKSYADDIYKQLRDEFEYLSSEESFVEHCEANNVTFEVELDEEEV